MSSWTGGRKRTKLVPPSVKQTLIVVTPLLFAKRDRQGKVCKPVEWSELMLRQAANNWEEVLILLNSNESILNENTRNLFRLLISLNISNIVQLVIYPTDNTEEMTNFLKTQLIQRGARIKPIRNPREVTYLNMRQHIEAPHMTWVSQNEHTKARIDLDKPKSFKDLQNERKQKSTWG